MDWGKLYPDFASDEGMKSQVRFADVGCGYGGLLGTVHITCMHDT